jgi:hypothetical protein
MNDSATVARNQERDFQVYQTLFLEPHTRVTRFLDGLE